MRFAFVPFVVLAASFTFAAAQSASTGDAAPPIRIDLMQRPTPVYVLNFPQTQAVEGTVAVSNLPAVQTVGGTVNVGNLPLDAEGAVRVTSAPALQPVLSELLASPVEIDGQTQLLTAAVSAVGFRSVAFRLQADNGSIVAIPEWHWAGDPPDVFTGMIDSRLGDSSLDSNCRYIQPDSFRTICLVAGDSVRFRIRNNDSGTPHTCTKASVYLIP